MNCFVASGAACILDLLAWHLSPRSKTSKRRFAYCKFVSDYIDLFDVHHKLFEALPLGKATGLDAVCDRKQILVDWDRCTQLPRPKLTHQGSDSFLKKRFKLCAHGEVGFFPMKNIISALPDADEKPTKTKRKATFDGWERVEEEEQAFPTTRRQIEKMHVVIRNNLSNLLRMQTLPNSHRG